MILNIMSRVTPDNIPDGYSGIDESAKDVLITYAIMILIIVVLLIVIAYLKSKISDLKDELEKYKNNKKY